MNPLRTPDKRFVDLPGYDFESHYVEVDGLRMHYVDEGPRDGSVVLLLHGEPSWSYLYRHMIPIIADAGLRPVAPDLIGFGRSDKPAQVADYSYARHIHWMQGFIEALDLQDITLVCQDWGSLIGLRVAVAMDDRFSRVVVANGFLPTGNENLPAAFKWWRRFARWSPWFPIGRIVEAGTTTELPDDVRRAYDAPFPSSKYKAGARAFPRLVPTSPDAPEAAENRAAWERWRQWRKPFHTAFSNRDPITRGADTILQREIPGAADVEHVTIKGGGHFLQEDRGPQLAEAVLGFIRPG